MFVLFVGLVGYMRDSFIVRFEVFMFEGECFIFVRRSRRIIFDGVERFGFRVVSVDFSEF